MSLVERLQAIVKERGTNFKQLESDCGIGNGVIRRWSTQSPRLDKLVKVATFLNVSLDYLVYGVDPKDDPACDDATSTSTERDLITMFRLLDQHDQETAFDIVTMLYEKATGKKGSVFSTYTVDELKRTSGPGENGEGQSGIA